MNVYSMVSTQGASAGHVQMLPSRNSISQLYRTCRRVASDWIRACGARFDSAHNRVDRIVRLEVNERGCLRDTIGGVEYGPMDACGVR
jgi:hypothetical protein